MGTYLSKPNTEKETQTGSSAKIRYASTSMQGWRVYQEDAHNCILNLADGWSLFAVYDGHGGPEVAQYTAERLPDFLKENLFKENVVFDQAFQDVFIEYDEHLRSVEAMKKLKAIAGLTKDNQPNETDEEVAKMIEEASLPVKELLEKYGVQIIPRQKGMGRSLADGVVADEECEDEEEEDHDEIENQENHCEDGLEKAVGKKRTSEDREREDSKRRKVDELEGDGKKAEPTTLETNHVENANHQAEEKTKNGSPTEDNGNAEEKPVAEKESNGNSGPKTDELDEDSDSSYKEEEAVDESEEEIDEEEEEEDEEEQEVIEAANMQGEVPGEDSGTTACVCLLSDTKIVVANIGDSRAVLCRDGKAIDLSVDHKPEDETETKRIEKAGGKVTEDGRVNGGLNLSRAFGDHFYKKNPTLSLADQMISALPDVITKEFLPEDRFVIVACDGIWNSMESQQVVDFVKQRLDNQRSLDSIVEELCDSCMASNTAGDGTGCDNMTVILIDLHKP